MIMLSACEIWGTLSASTAVFVIAEAASSRRIPVYFAALSMILGTFAGISDGASETVVRHEDKLILARLATDRAELRPLFRKADADGRITIKEWRSIWTAEHAIVDREQEDLRKRTLAEGEAELRALQAPARTKDR